MDDLISRQAAIDAACDGADEWDGGSNEWRDKFITEFIEAVPSAQPTNISKTEDLIIRGDAINAVFERIKQIGFEDNVDVLSIRQAVRELPSAQPEIIACGDCKHWVCHDRRCSYWNHGVKPLDWCSKAERRTDETD